MLYQNMMMKIVLCLSCLVLVGGGITQESQAVIKKHHQNFYIFQNDGELFFPHTVNVSELIQPQVTEAQIKQCLANIAALGANSVRFVIDDVFPARVPLDQYEQFDGALREDLLDRIDLIVEAADANGLYCIPVFFDIQEIAMQWNEHPHNQRNGGDCAQLMDYFTNNTIMSRTLQRVKQLVSRYQGKNIFAWEIARGANVWDNVEGLMYKPSSEYIERVSFWFYRVLSQIKSSDDANHLIAVTHAPNTMPHTIMNHPYIDINFLQIQSSRTPELIVQSVPEMIITARTFKKPVFISELHLTVEDHRLEPMTSSTYWSALASSSGAFLSVQELKLGYDLLPEDQRRLESAQIFLNSVDLSGLPRPEAKAPAQTIPSETYLLAQSLVGNDWLFYVLRKNPGTSKAKMEFNTVEGTFEFFWMDFENSQRHPLKEFTSTRKWILMESPEFYEGIIGRLRLKERYLPSDKAEEETSEESQENNTTGE